MNKIDDILDSLQGRQPELTDGEELTTRIMANLPDRRHRHEMIPLRWLMAGIAASIMLLVGFSLLKPLSLSVLGLGDNPRSLGELDIKSNSFSFATPRGGEDSLSSEGKEDYIGLAALPPKGGPGRGADKKEEVLAEVHPAPQPVKKRRKADRKQSTLAEPVQTEAKPMNRQIEFEPVNPPTDSEPSYDDFAQIQDIRARGERLQRMVDAMINE
ncbi:MAG: hypothetical protein IJT75_05275 [Bacteroidaceae bacterium]|nr:hypothetical protein [Bacteroidaceae bacterium]